MQRFSDAVEKLGEVKLGLEAVIFKTAPSAARVYFEQALEDLKQGMSKFTSKQFNE